jgi:basic amino acid/polyamine antiporter, APA family
MAYRSAARIFVSAPPWRSGPDGEDPAPRPEAAPRPLLRIREAVGIIVGTILGVGIFKTPSLVGASVGTEQALLMAWAAGGLVSLTGALCYAELAATYPHAGGDYHFLTRAFGARLSFLFAWARLAVIQTGSIALLGFVLGDYASALLPLGPASSAVYAALVVAALTALHVSGVSHGTRAQNLLTSVGVLGVLLVVGAGFMAPAAATAVGADAGARPTALGLVMVFVLLTYGGWNEAAYVSAELREPGRNMAQALVVSLLLVTLLYVLVNWAYLRGLGLAGLAASTAPAADLMTRLAGDGAGALVSLLVVVSGLTSVSATIFTGSRTAYALGGDFGPLAALGRWHSRRDTPVNALVAQAAIALLLVTLGALTRRGFETMVEFTAPVFWTFMLLTGVGLFVLRHRDPARPRPFRVPLYPLTPLLFCATCAYLLYASLAYTGVGALVGVGVVAVGVVILVCTRSLRRS